MMKNANFARKNANMYKIWNIKNARNPAAEREKKKWIYNLISILIKYGVIA